jgi:MoaA/NifB/PqqE/SkfB family radical SAM enzyme
MALVGLHLEIIWECNLRCSFCPRNHYPVGQRYLKAEQVEEIIRRLPTVETVDIVGLGEPLLHPQWFEIMEALKRHDKGLAFATNGQLLSEDKIRSLPQPCAVFFSIEALDAEKYRELRRGGDLGVALDAISLLRRLRPDVVRHINMLLTKKNYDQLEPMRAFAEKQGTSLIPLYPLTFTREDFDEFYPEEPHPYSDQSRPARCLEAFGTVLVNIKGEIYPCCYIYEGRAADKTPDFFPEHLPQGVVNVPQHQYKLGNIFHDDVYVIWAGKQMDSIRRSAIAPPRLGKSFDELRKETDLSVPHAYCKICAWRWGRIC